LPADGGQAVQHGRLGVFEVRDAKTRFGDFFLRDFDFGIGDGLLSPSPTASRMLHPCGVSAYLR
jgi:hypothetical protein